MNVGAPMKNGIRLEFTLIIKTNVMSQMLAIAYDSLTRAKIAEKKVRELEEEHHAIIEDIVIAEVTNVNEIKLHENDDLTTTSALSGGFWGAFIGLLFSGPLGMVVVGGISAALGALSANWVDYGISEKFINRLTKHLKPNKSVLFILLKEVEFTHLAEKIKPLKGEVMHSSFSKSKRAKLESALSQ